MASVHTCKQGGMDFVGLEITFDSAHFFAIIFDNKLRFSISECKNDSILKVIRISLFKVFPEK